MKYTLDKEDVLVDYEVFTNGSHEVKVSLFDKEGNCVARSIGKKGQPKDAAFVLKKRWENK